MALHAKHDYMSSKKPAEISAVILLTVTESQLEVSAVIQLIEAKSPAEISPAIS